MRAQRLILPERGLNPTSLPTEQRLPSLDLDVVPEFSGGAFDAFYASDFCSGGTRYTVDYSGLLL